MYEIVERVAPSLEGVNAKLKDAVLPLLAQGYRTIGGVSHLHGYVKGTPVFMASQGLIRPQQPLLLPSPKTVSTAGYKAGMPWTDSEDDELRSVLADGTFAAIRRALPARSVRHQRTPWAVALRAVKLGLITEDVLDALRPQFYAKPIVQEMTP